MIEAHFGNEYRGMRLSYVHEHTSLGTGGAIANGLKYTTQNEVMIFNGDTFLGLDIRDFYTQHTALKTPLTIALKPMENFERYGRVIHSKGEIEAFHEKAPCKKGVINGGVYCGEVAFLTEWMQHLTPPFSFETDVLERLAGSGKLGGVEVSGYFIDIGIPEDYEKAQVTLPSEPKRS